MVPPPLTSKAQSSVPLFNPRGVQLEKEDALVLQGKCFFTRFPERYPFFHSAGIAGNYMITIGGLVPHEAKISNAAVL